MKTNKEFYEDILRYEDEGKLVFMPRTIPSEHFRMNVYKKVISLHISLVDFAEEIKEKIESHDFFTQKALEKHLGRSITYVNRLVDDDQYFRFTRGKGIKFYLKKDW